ncbi:Valacyclovir hydrolase [Eumeta japonica]|uniref:Valacyclovir hydrolase n=1 Tax=Eumeta variegata TaxID=151549 RepID=A0A4C2A9N3_EUMVA|nr:Valacyclovir hydrolase [Eumeta japonica]
MQISVVKAKEDRRAEWKETNESSPHEQMEEKLIIGKHKINYLKVGDGPHKVFCLPGALGTIWTDFKPQIEGLDKSKFTIIAWDPPGYGKSRPPEKDFSPDFYEVDALAAHNLMQMLEITKYSILGWSDGGITGMIMAAKFPQEVTKLAIWGANSFILPTELQIYDKIKDIRTWSPKMKQPMIEVYGEDAFSKLWAAWVEGVKNLYHEKKGNICREMLKT